MKMTATEKIFEEYIADLSMSAVSSSIYAYRSAMKPFFKFIGKKTPEIVSLRDVSNFMLIESKIKKGVTVKYYRGIIIRFWEWMRDHGHIQNNPLSAKKLPRIVTVPPDRKAFTYEMHLKIIEAAGKQDRSFQWRELCIVGWNTGLRISDASNLKWTDVNFDDETIEVLPQKTRRFNKRLVIPIEPELFEMLDGLRKNPDHQSYLQSPYCFPTMARTGIFSETVAGYHFRKILREAGIPDEYSFHSYRHAMVSRLVNANVNPIVISSITGQSLEIILLYSHVSHEAKRNAMASARPVTPTVV